MSAPSSRRAKLGMTLARRAKLGMTRARRGERGMTLIELVVALGLLALIVGTLAASIGVSTRGSAAIDARVEYGEALRIAQSTLRRYIAQARPARVLIGQRDQVVFVGEPEQMGFVAVMPPWPGGGGVYRVRLAVEDSEAGRALVLTRQATAGETASFEFGPAAERTVLLAGVAALRWSYFGLDQNARQGAWYNAWRGASQLPKLVRLEVQFSDPRAPSWPAMIVALPLDQGPR